MNKIIYLGFYATPESDRRVSLAGVTMMDYIRYSLFKIGYECCIVSPAQCSHYSKRVVTTIDYNQNLIYTPSYPLPFYLNIPKRYLIRLRRRADLYEELYSMIDEGDVIIAYHSLYYIQVLKRLRKKIKFTLILQVCEIYADVLNNKYLRMKELKWINEADAYLFSTDNLNEIINYQKKPYITCLGTYKFSELFESKFDDGKIHVVYAGTFDSNKGGAEAAVTSAAFLSDKYCMHILGFGTKRDTDYLKKLISETQEKTSCLISFEGCLSGQDYINFIQRCHIGLSTQNPDASFNSTSFPSKILSYLANGLYVVSVRIPVIEESIVGKFITYYKDQNPKCIAKAIEKVNIESTNPREVLCNIDNDFRGKLKEFIEQCSK